MVNIAGVYFTEVYFEDAVRRIEEHVLDRRPHNVVTANVDFVVIADRDPEFKKIINTSDAVVADGMPIIWASRFLGMPLPERIAGLDLALKFCELSQNKDYRIYFLGAADSVRIKAMQCLKARYPGINIAGSYSPPFGQFSKEEEGAIIDKIRSSSANLLFVCFGARKQQAWIHRHISELGVTAIGVGSFLDFAAGEFMRAPLWAQRVGLEWLFRFIQNPVRLFKRYFIDDIRFFYIVMMQKMGMLQGEGRGKL